MAPSQPTPFPPAGSPSRERAFTRRQFLAGLGLLSGAGVLAPVLQRMQRPSAASIEAGRPLLGTWVRIVARHPDRDRATRAVERAFAAMREVDGQMSVHRADSELSRVNRAAGLGPVRVSPALLDVVEQACACARRSGGLYDPTVLPLMTLYGFYGPERVSLPTTAEVDRALATVAFEDVRVDRGAGTIALARRGMGLDLGSIGKGWAVDRAVEALRAAGVGSGLVDAGGNVYGLGVPEDGADGWSVALFHPRSGRAERDFMLRDTAVATSANNERYRVIAGHRFGHIFDARRGAPCDGHVSVSVLARTGVESDQMSTAAFLLGPSRFRGWPGSLDALFL
jgi:thiamine biosynthesis lipoprotein